MARPRFTRLDDGDFVFRLAVVGRDFVPDGCRVPLPRWWELTEKEKAALDSGERSGATVWDHDLTTVDQARCFRFDSGDDAPETKAFGLGVGRLRSIGVGHDRPLDVVADPHPSGGPGADGHSIVEGLRRPRGSPRTSHRSLLTDLAYACEEVADP